MSVTFLHTLSIVAVIAVATFATRAVPFALFPGSRKPPKYIVYLGEVLPYAIIGMLVIYCLKGVSLTAAPYGMPELIAIAVIVVLHLWKKNNLLSIGGGTLLYMALVQFVFA